MKRSETTKFLSRLLEKSRFSGQVNTGLEK